MAHIFLGLGSNLGDREAHLRNAMGILSENNEVSRISSIYQSTPFYHLDQPLFLNCVIALEIPQDPNKTRLSGESGSPLAFLRYLKTLECQIGREQTFPNGPRVIDIDILVYGDLCLNTPELTLPHPRLHERPFVLIPLVEIAPDLMIPSHQKTATELLTLCPDQHLVKKHTP